MNEDDLNKIRYYFWDLRLELIYRAFIVTNLFAACQHFKFISIIVFFAVI